MAHQTPIYLDHAAATPVDSTVLAAMQPFFSDNFYNPSATYTAARSARNALESARAEVAQCLGARSSEIIFTAGGSEANNLAIHGIMRLYPEAKIVVSAVEHDAVLAPAARYNVTHIPVIADGRVDREALLSNIDDSTVLVSIMYANNEVGTIQPIKEIAQMLKQVKDDRRTRGVKLPLYFHTDACQASNYLDLHVARLGVDLMTINGGKIYGPKQSGALYVRAGVLLQPLIDGGGQEFGLRSGTESVANAVGLATALKTAQVQRHQEGKRLADLQHACITGITNAIPTAIINGSTKHRLPNNIHITLPGADNERLLFALDEQGILAAAGSACSASDEEPSHVLKAMGISEQDAQASLRLTMGRSTTIEMVEKTIEVLSALYNQPVNS